eukprot:scaffold444_cov109-Cylindrotheca_fusiformis.AAC.3
MDISHVKTWGIRGILGSWDIESSNVTIPTVSHFESGWIASSTYVSSLSNNYLPTSNTFSGQRHRCHGNKRQANNPGSSSGWLLLMDLTLIAEYSDSRMISCPLVSSDDARFTVIINMIKTNTPLMLLYTSAVFAGAVVVNDLDDDNNWKAWWLLLFVPRDFRYRSSKIRGQGLLFRLTRHGTAIAPRAATAIISDHGGLYHWLSRDAFWILVPGGNITMQVLTHWRDVQNSGLLLP